MSCTAQHGIQGIAKGAFEPVAVKLAIALHMSNGRFDGIAPWDSPHGHSAKTIFERGPAKLPISVSIWGAYRSAGTRHAGHVIRLGSLSKRSDDGSLLGLLFAGTRACHQLNSRQYGRSLAR